MTPTARGRRALTLVELLTVVSVITILTSLMSPVLLRLPQEATRARCTANLGDVAEALHLIENDIHRLPACFDVDAAGAVDENSWWYHAVVRKSGHHTATHDQLNVPRDQDPWWTTPASRGFLPFRPERCTVRCPASTDHYDDYYSDDTIPKATSLDKDRVYDHNYGYNNTGFDYAPGYGDTCTIHYPYDGRIIARSRLYHSGAGGLNRPIRGHHAADPASDYTHVGAPSGVPDKANTILVADYVKADASPLIDQRIVAGTLYDGYEFRHAGKCNLLFADGHVEGYRESHLRRVLADGTITWSVRKRP